MKIWPNLFIVGAPKAGTTSLHQYLSCFPDVYMSPVKEPNFFSKEIYSDDSDIRPIRNQSRYLSLFRGGGSLRYRGEASPAYLLDRTAPKLIRRVSPEASILITLRDPVELAYSFYFTMLGRRQTSLSFSQAVLRRLSDEPLD